MSFPNSLPKDALAALVASLSGFDPKTVIWSGDPNPFIGPRGGSVKGLITLNLIGSKQIGYDDMRRTADTNTGILHTEQDGMRIHTVSMRCDAYGNDVEGFDYLEQVRTRLQRDATRATLRAAALSLVDYTTVTTLSYNVGNRWISSASLDVRFLQTISDDATANGDNWIDRATGTGTYQNDDSRQYFIPTNLLSWGWGDVGGLTCVGGQPDPIGASQAFKLVEPIGSTGFEHFWSFHSPPGPPGQVQPKAHTKITASVYFKPNGRNWAFIYITGALDQFRGAYFNMQTGMVGHVDGPNVSVSITGAGNGWYLCTVVFSDPPEDLTSFTIGPSDLDNNYGGYSGNGSGIYVYGPLVNGSPVKLQTVPFTAP